MSTRLDRMAAWLNRANKFLDRMIETACGVVFWLCLFGTVVSLVLGEQQIAMMLMLTALVSAEVRRREGGRRDR